MHWQVQEAHVAARVRAAADRTGFSETRYATGEKHYSDHCPIAVTLRR